MLEFEKENGKMKNRKFEKELSKLLKDARKRSDSAIKAESELSFFF